MTDVTEILKKESYTRMGYAFSTCKQEIEMYEDLNNSSKLIDRLRRNKLKTKYNVSEERLTKAIVRVIEILKKL